MLHSNAPKEKKNPQKKPTKEKFFTGKVVAMIYFCVVFPCCYTAVWIQILDFYIAKKCVVKLNTLISSTDVFFRVRLNWS